VRGNVDAFFRHGFDRREVDARRLHACAASFITITGEMAQQPFGHYIKKASDKVNPQFRKTSPIAFLNNFFIIPL